MTDEYALLIGLCLVPGIGGVTLRRLLDRFGSVAAIREATPALLDSVPGVGPRITAALQAIDPAAVDARITRWTTSGITLLTWSDLRYPDRLFALPDAPPLLFCRGSLPLPHEDTVAIVGTRHPTPASRHLAEDLGEALAARGWIVVSGLAWGVDTAAHSGALRAGRTVAILGGGINRIPEKQQDLARRIAASGLVCSELPPEVTPAPAGLVARNRLISGMSRAVIVIEAGETSGSLYTARFAYKQGRPILAVPNGSAGNTRLLENGAQPLPADPDALDACLRAT